MRIRRYLALPVTVAAVLAASLAWLLVRAADLVEGV